MMKHKTLFLLLFVVLFTYNSIQVFSGEIQEWEKQSKDTPWYELTAGHFVVMYQEEFEPIALEVAKYGEIFYETYKDTFQYDLKKKIPIVLLQGTRPTGSYDPALPTIITFMKSGEFATKGSNWMYYVLSHEFAHYFHLQYDGGLGTVLSKFIGPFAKSLDVYAATYLLIEGLATTIESDVSPQGRRYQPSFLLPIRADMLLSSKEERETYLDTTQIYTKNELAMLSSRRYSYGQQLYTYIREVYGYQVLVDIWKHFVKFPIDVSSRAKKFAGKTMYELHDEMLVWLEAQYKEYETFPRGTEIADNEDGAIRYTVLGSSDRGVLLAQAGLNITQGYQLYNNGTYTKIIKTREQPRDGFFYGGNKSASITKDGSNIVYEHPSLQFLSLYDLDTKKEIKIAKNQKIGSPVISGDGTFIIANQYHTSYLYARLIHIDLENEAYKKGYRVLYDPKEANIRQKAISPDKKTVVFVEHSHLEGISIKSLDISTGAVTTLLQRDYGLSVVGLSFIDANTLLLSADIEHPGEVASIYTVTLDNNTWTRIARDKVGIASVNMQEDGSVIYASYNKEGDYSLYTYKKSELTNVPVDIESIETEFFTENLLAKYSGGTQEQIDTPIVGSHITLGQELEYSKKRIYPSIPSRFLLGIPYFGIMGTNLLNVGYQVQVAGKKGSWDTLLILDAGLQVNTLQPLYTVTYTKLIGVYNIAFRNLIGGESFYINFLTSREYRYSQATKKHEIAYQQNFSLGTSAPLFSVTQITHVQHSQPIKFLETTPDTIYSEIQFKAALPWSIYKSKSSAPLSVFSNPLALQVTPSIVYTPPLFDIHDHRTSLLLDGYGQVPIGRTAFRLSMYNALSTTNIASINTERFARVGTEGQGILSVAGNPQYFAGGTGSIATPLQSSFALDFVVPFTYRLGSHLLQPFANTFGLFAEQTVGYDFDSQQGDINQYLVVGTEGSLSFAILAFPLVAKVGATFKVPYQSDIDFDYSVYVGLSFNNKRIHETLGLSGSRDFF